MNAKKFVGFSSVYSSPDGRARGSFVPRGNPVMAGKRINPADWESAEPPYAARFLIGFNVGKTPRWTMKDLVSRTKLFLKHHRLPEDSSYVHQAGVYTHASKRAEEVVTERGAQLIVLKFPFSEWDQLTDKQFETLMMALAEWLCDELIQKQIILVMSRGGIETRTYGMSGNKPYPEEKLFGAK